MNNYLVYCAKFPNGKMYIGLTGKTLERRKSEHYKPRMKFAVHSAIKFYKGQETWEVLAYGLTKEEAAQKEIALIKELNTKAPHGYNLTDGGEGTSGHAENSLATKIKMYSSVPFEVYTVDGAYVSEYLFQAVCAKELSIPQSKISHCLKGKSFKTHGYRFKYKNEDFQYIPKKASGGRPHGYKASPETKAKIAASARLRPKKEKEIKQKKTKIERSISNSRAQFKHKTLTVTREDDVTFRKEYLSPFECALDLSLNNKSIAHCLHKPEIRSSLFGYKFETKASN